MSEKNSQSQLPETNRERDLEGLRQAVELISGDPTSATDAGQSTSITQTGDVRRTVSVQSGLPGEANGHELLHVLHTPRKQPKAVQENRLVHSVWNCLEDGRINRIGNKKFGRHLKEVHEEQWQQGFDSDPLAARSLRAGGNRQNADALALSQVVFGVSGVVTTGDKFRDGLLNKMKPAILKTVDSGTAADVSGMAVRLAYLFDLLEEKRQDEARKEREKEREREEREEQPEEEQPEAEGEGEGEGVDEDAEDEGDPTGGEPDGDPTSGDSGTLTSDREDVTVPVASDAGGAGNSGDDEDDEPSDGTEKVEVEVEKSNPGLTEYDGEAELERSRERAEGQEEAKNAEGDTELEWNDETIERLIEEAADEAADRERKVRQAVTRAERAEAKAKAAPTEQREGPVTTIGGTYSYPKGLEDHVVRVIPDNLPLTVLNPGLAITELSASLPGGSKRQRELRSGLLDSGAAYRLGMGDFRVFEETKGDNARLVIMVDTSGSMGSYEEPEERDTISVSGATIAWDTVAALTERYPQAEVFTFRSWSARRTAQDHYKDHYGAVAGTIIQPVPVGFRLERQTGENSDCAMLLWLEEYLEGDLGSATVVLISDGYPAGGSVRCESIGHTREIAHDLYEKGLRYISVLVKMLYSDLYPSDVIATVNGEGDYDNLIEAFAELDARGF